MDIKKKSLAYFKCFSNKNLEELKSFFSETVYLRDWDIEAKGIKRVLEANKKIFDSVETINVKPIDIYKDRNFIIAELEILVNQADKLLVVDVISFNSSFKINSIKAYKG